MSKNLSIVNFKILKGAISFLAFLSIVFMFSCRTNKTIIKNNNSPQSTYQNNSIEKLSILDFEKLKSVKKAINNDSDVYRISYKSLIKKANKALKEGPFSVTYKTQIPISGDKHDYLSIGPYWWPDPTKQDGLPWINKDGQVNPITLGKNLDLQRKGKMFRNTHCLAMAYFFTGNEEYANKAIKLLQVWFLNPETKMNPNLNYAQGIPGRTDGRGIGIIEFIGIKEVLTAIELLELGNRMDQITSKGLRSWLKEYLSWLQYSKNGIDESKMKNNHGTWYDAQVVSLLLFFNRQEEAKTVLQSVKKNRIESQITRNGEFPLELKRTRPLHYSAYNLEAFTYLAYFGKKINVDLWNYSPTNAGGIKDAYRFLYPFAKQEKKWNSKNIGGLNGGLEYLKEVFFMAGNMFDVQEYIELDNNSIKKDNYNNIRFSF